jgi:SOS-response transcriptional repressor LexA/DNA-binding XRE family transcriptional regulator
MALDIERFKAERKKKGLTQQKLSEMLHISRGTVAMWEIGKNIPPTEMLEELSEIFNCSVDYLLGKSDTRVDDALLDLVNTIPDDLLQQHGNVYDALRAMQKSNLPSNVRPISSLHRQRVPLIGGVAAGEPIYDPEDAGVYVESPVDADAAITIHGDSMIPTYQDGDLVYIKARPDVPEGAVAVVFLDDEATLKHVYKRPTGLTLWSDNTAYAPMNIEFEDYANVRIFGVPVGYTRIYKPAISGKIRKGF